jgi:hypothetical protein
VQTRLKPSGKESLWPQMTPKDVLQLRLASAAAENPLWHEFVTGHHKQYTFDLKSGRRIASEVLIKQRPPLLSWTAVNELWANIDYNGPLPAANPALGRCWLWRGRKHPDGYGVIRTPKYNMLGQRMKHGAKKMPVYVVTFLLDRGRFPKPCCRHNARDRQRMGQTKGYPNAMIHSLEQVQGPPPVTEY